MANVLYDSGREGILDGSISMASPGITTALVAGYTFSAAHKWLTDIAGTLAATQVLTGPSFTAGVYDAANVTFPTVPAGPPCGALVIYNDTGTPSTSRLIAFIDTASGLPVTPSGVDIPVVWDAGANKIFRL